MRVENGKRGVHEEEKYRWTAETEDNSGVED